MMHFDKRAGPAFGWPLDQEEGLDMAFDFTGKTAIVTGGTQGIGLEIAKGIVEGGGHVVLLARNAKKG